MRSNDQISEECLLERGREMVSEANGGRPDFVGFIAALRIEAEETDRMFGSHDEKRSEAKALQELADRIERIGERYGFI